MNKSTKTRYDRVVGLLSAAALGFMGAANAAQASTFTLDGIYDPSNDAYSHQFLFPLVLDNGTPVGDGSLKVGIGSNADGVTGGDNDLFLYFEVPLSLKDMTWGSGTHDGYSESSKDVVGGEIAMNQNTGSEKIEFQWNGEDVEVKLSQRGNGKKQDDLSACSDAKTCIGHELSKSGGGAVIAARTSLDYIMANFPNNPGEFNLWGDISKEGDGSVSNSPTLKTDENGDDIYETVDPAFAKWPFHQSWEIQISGDFDESDLANLLSSEDFFGADFGGSKPEDSNFLLHASPIKAGEKFDIVPNCTPTAGQNDSCMFDEIPDPSPVPVPASLPLLIAGMIGLGALARRRRSA